ncbi:hypothetical protein CAOG_02170 [Capsaspora owczarzaki ATCC 30864]|uniref:MABP domain-containing protein n=1 Tax=Capsaspora owczarzaki (strain ATCC 30864) TaxID=595528 RepID=A0A0D2VLF6_CAPO3|nr:hypothetical protein CAOG_02170 [Capsaspora owczarzaki ATCC 30864]KJE90947.1 hypothetical protein CAOG_002170 [Capsaspora owczarzaki ATCC 30864]|eukprot:XP_004348920.1 hypothetical protein CAOG_02170 [Capsaspora owczarzaki ATCC 30864]
MAAPVAAATPLGQQSAGAPPVSSAEQAAPTATASWFQREQTLKRTLLQMIVQDELNALLANPAAFLAAATATDAARQPVSAGTAAGTAAGTLDAQFFGLANQSASPAAPHPPNPSKPIPHSILAVARRKLLAIPHLSKHSTEFAEAFDAFVLALPQFIARHDSATSKSLSKRIVNWVVGNIAFSLPTTGERDHRLRTLDENPNAFVPTVSIPNPAAEIINTMSDLNTYPTVMTSSTGDLPLGPDHAFDMPLEHSQSASPGPGLPFPAPAIREELANAATFAQHEEEADLSEDCSAELQLDASSVNALADQLQASAVLRTQFLEMFNTLLLASDRKSGGSNAELTGLLDLLVASHSIQDLPPALRVFFDAQRDQLVARLMRLTKKQKRHMRIQHHLMPRRALLAVFSVASASTLFSTLKTILLTKTMGMNLLQRSVASAVDLAECNEAVRVAARQVDTLIAEKVRSFVRFRMPIGPLPYDFGCMQSFLQDPTLQPVLSKSLIDKYMSDQRCFFAYKLLCAEMQRSDRQAYIDMLGEDSFGNLVEHLLRFMQEIVGAVLNDSFSSLLSAAFDSWAELVTISQMKGLQPNELAQKYHVAMHRLHDGFFQALHRAVVFDRGVVSDLLTFLFDSWGSIGEALDVFALASSKLSEPDYAALWREVDFIADFRDKGKHAAKAAAKVAAAAGLPTGAIPHSTLSHAFSNETCQVSVIPLLLGDFRVAVLTRLGQSIESNSINHPNSSNASTSTSAHSPAPPSPKIITQQPGRPAFLSTSSSSSLLLEPSAEPVHEGGALTYVEVAYQGDSVDLMHQRGFRRLEVDINRDATLGITIHIWFKTTPFSARKGHPLLRVRPITALAVSTSDAEAARLHARGFILIKRALNKSIVSKRNVFLWYLRGEAGAAPIVDLAVSRGKDMDFSNQGFSRLPTDLNTSSSGKSIFLWTRHGVPPAVDQ